MARFDRQELARRLEEPSPLPSDVDIPDPADFDLHDRVGKGATRFEYEAVGRDGKSTAQMGTHPEKECATLRDDHFRRIQNHPAVEN